MKKIIFCCLRKLEYFEKLGNCKIEKSKEKSHKNNKCETSSNKKIKYKAHIFKKV